MNPMLNIAIRAARKAVNLINKYYETPSKIKIRQKSSSSDLVTSVDTASENIIIEMIKKFYPKHSILAEETGIHIGTDQDVQWIIDPLDGTANFARQLPHFAVSIAARIKGRTEIAVIYDPIRNELFTAARGQGAQLNGFRLRSSSNHSLSSSIIAIGFPLKTGKYSSYYLDIIKKLFTECIDFRRTGSAALDLAYIAAGRIDGYFEIGLKSWDFAAGDLIAREAGALICDFTGGCDYLSTGNIVAGNHQIVKNILSSIRSVLNK